MKSKKKNKGLIVIIVILLILLLGSIGYICYVKGIINLNGEKATKYEVDQYFEKYSVHMKNGQQKTFYKNGEAY